MTLGQTGVWATLLHQLQVSHMVKQYWQSV